jgi:glycosyltransferase involved in cell wall biosynthesis
VRSPRSLNRTKICLIKGTLAQGGAERYTFEICRAFDPERFEVELLCVEGTGLADQYYGARLAARGFRIREALPRIRDALPRIGPLSWLNRFPYLRRFLVTAQYAFYKRRVQALFRDYDVIGIVQIESLLLVDRWLPAERPLVIHLMSHLLQYRDDVYLKSRARGRYFLICQDEAQLEEAKVLGSHVLSATVVPLPLDSSDFAPLIFERTEPLAIGTFIRISPERPLIPLFEAFSELLQKTDALFRHYGRGDSTELRRQLNAMGVGDRVTFAGHSSDIRSSLIEDGVNFVWMTAFDDSLGYASLEVAAMAAPCCFYNVGRGLAPEEVRSRTAGAVNCFRSPAELADATLAIWKDEERYRNLGPRLRQFVQQRHDIQERIAQIEQVYVSARTGADGDFSGLTAAQASPANVRRSAPM